MIEILTRRRDHDQGGQATQTVAVGAALTGAVVVTEPGRQLRRPDQDNRRQDQGHYRRRPEPIVVCPILEAVHVIF